MVCLRTDMPEVQAQLDKYTNILGSEDAAYYVLSENNGYDLSMAPNGLPSKLFSDLLSHFNGNEEQAIRAKAKVFTESFKTWFGDWLGEDTSDVSKAVDGNGEPQIFWHGTDLTFEEFELDLNHERGTHAVHPADVGFFFTDTQDKAFQYKHDITMPVYLNLRNPGRTSVVEEDVIDNTENEVRVLRDELYDGAVIERFDKEEVGIPTTQWVVKDANQIKSIYNEGQFSTQNGSIYRSNSIPASKNTVSFNSIFDSQLEETTSDDIILGLTLYVEDIPQIKNIFELVLNSGTKVRIVESERLPYGQAYMYYDVENDTIVVAKDAFNENSIGYNAISFAHEMVHALTARSINKAINGVASRTELLLYTKLQNLYDKVRPLFQDSFNEKGEYVGNMYGLTNIHEFAAELMTNQDFYETVLEAANRLPRNFLESLVNTLREIWNHIAELLHLPTIKLDDILQTITDLMSYNLTDQQATEDDLYRLGVRNNAKRLYTISEEARRYNFNTEEELRTRLRDIRKNLATGLESRLKAIQRDPEMSFEAKEQARYQIQQLNDNTLDTFAVLNSVINELSKDVVVVSREVLNSYSGKADALTDERLVSLNKNYFGFYTGFVNNLYNSLNHLDAYVQIIGEENYRRTMLQLTLCMNVLNSCSDHLKRMLVENAKRILEEAGIKAKCPTIHAYLEENTKETDFDVSFITRILFSLDNANDNALKTLFLIVQLADNNVVLRTFKVARKLLGLSKLADLKKLFETDENGKPTGYIVRDLLYGKMYRDYRNALKKIRLDLGILETDLSLPENRELRIEYNKRKDKWLADHVERKYTSEYYALFRELSLEATDAREAVVSRIRNLQLKYRNTQGVTEYERFSLEDWNTLQGLYVEKRALSSIYRPDGTIKEEGSVERRIAEELSELNRKLADNIKYKANKTKFEQVRKAKAEQYGEDSKEYKLWLSRNTRMVISEEFYEKLALIERETYPDTDYADLQELKRAILNIYRDPFTGEVNGRIIPTKVKNVLNRIDSRLSTIRKNHKPKKSKTGLRFKDIARIVATDAYKEDRNKALALDTSESPGELESFDAINSWFDFNHDVHPRSFYSKVVPTNPAYITFEPSLEFAELSDESVFYNKNYDRNNPEYYQPKRSLYDNSKEYNRIMKDKNLRELRLAIIDTMTEAQSKLVNRNNLNPYKLPLISGSTYRYIKSRGLFKGIGGSVLDSFTTNDDTTGIQKRVATAADGTTLDMIPQYFLEDLEDPSVITADMVGSVILFYKMAINFEEKSAIRAKCETIKQFLRLRKYTGESGGVRGAVKNLLNIRNKPKEGLDTNIYRMAEEFINMNVYDRQNQSWLVNLFNRDINITKMILMLKRFGTLVNLGLNFACAFTGWFTALHAHLSNIVAGRYYTFSGAMHAFSDIIYDLFRHGINTIGNTNYKSEQMQLMDYFEVGSTLDSIYRNSNRPRILRAILGHWAFGIYSLSDYIIKGQILNSVMYDYKNVDGHFISHEEFFRTHGGRTDANKAKWDKYKSFKGSIKMVAGELRAINPKDLKAVDEIKNTIGNTARAVAARADGQLTSLLKAQFTVNAFGACCMMHRNYIPALLQERITMKRQWDYTSQREAEAIMQTPLRLFGLLARDKFTAQAFSDAFSEIRNDELTRSNLRKLVFETITVFGIYPFLAAVLNDAADDDKDDIVLNLFAYVMLRTSFETKAAYTLIDVYNTLKQPTPLTSVTDNISNVFKYSMLPVTGLLLPHLYDKDLNDKITRGSYKGMTRLERALWKLTPFKNVKELNDIPSKRRYYETQIMQ